MTQKYRVGQKIKIIEVKSEYGHPKYPEIQDYVNETGIILDFIASMQGIEGTTLEGKEYAQQYLYNIRIDRDGTILEAVTEDALAALDE